MAQVILNNVVKRFGKTEVVHGVDLTIADNEFLVLVGPSGCGKSTLLRMVAGLEEISEGRILIDGKVVNDVAPKDRGCAMVFQNYALYPHMNVYKNMSFGLTIKGFSKTEIEQRVQEAAKILGIGELLARKPHELSGGQRQRVAMGRAIVRNPSVFLFDEPLSNLDAKLRNSMRTEIKRLHQKVRSTIIYVTHDQVEAMTLADRIVVMRSGRVEQIGTPIELFERPANTFVAGFIGSPPMNLVGGKLLRTGGGCQAILSEGLRIPIPDKGQMDTLADEQKVVFGIRTESIRPLFGSSRPIMEGEWSTTGLVEVVEPLGGETHLHTDINGVKFTAKCDGRQRISEGTAMSFAFRLEAIHLFDDKNQQGIY
ncbi:MAG: glycerol-3-phosphate ABC transporter ATP-binding protein [Desulfobacterales bacterium GWB2_56_26]|nr:MAG: glycerol-3-phosphate ABC transporter ATP-binding protein [Desulfobacterales bacterium GWB2_56_26]